MKLTKTAPSPPPPDPVRVALAQAIAAKAEAERKVSDAKKLIETRIDVWLDLVHKAEQARAARDDRGVDARERAEAFASVAAGEMPPAPERGLRARLEGAAATAEAAATSAFRGLERLREMEKSLTAGVGTAERQLDRAISDVLTPTLDGLIAEVATLADELSARRQLLEHIRGKILSVESTVYSRVFRAVYLERPPVDAAAIAPELARWIAMAEALANDPDAPLP